MNDHGNETPPELSNRTDEEQLKDDTGAALGSLLSAFAETERFLKIGSEISYPIEVASVRCLGSREQMSVPPGSWCAVRIAGGDSRTYLGVYLGDLILNLMPPVYDTRDKCLSVMAQRNPAIFVPDIKRVVWGCESWWGLIKEPGDLRKITNADIQNVWYMRALKELNGDDTAPAQEAASRRAASKRGTK